MPRYNIAFLPSDPVFATSCITAAQKQFTECADNYLLNRENSFPHVTLCQFDAGENQLKDIWNEMKVLEPQRLPLSIITNYARRGSGKHEKHMWVGLIIARKPKLVQMQEEIYNKLKARDLVSHTVTGEAYWPHLTLARITETDPKEIKSYWLQEIMKPVPQIYYLTLGLSDSMGMYRKRLFPA